MISKGLQLPIFVRVSIFFIGIVALTAILYVARGIIIPLVFAIIFAILLQPVVNFFVRWKINRILSIILVMLLTAMVLVSFVALLVSQISKFGDTWPQLVDKFSETLNKGIAEAAGYLDLKPQIIQEWITQSKGELLDFSKAAIGKTLVTVGNALMITLLVPVYIFLILFYQPLLIEFIHRLFSSSDHSKIREIVDQIKSVIQRYLSGLMIEALLVASMNISALLILGIEYAVLLGIIGAILNVIPYIGGLVAVALPMMVAFATKTSAWYALYVLGAYYFIQLIDNNFIIPYIVASKVKINALFSIIVVLVGNALWGVPGMFLSIPLLAILKLLFDHIGTLKPWGFLLGDSMAPILTIEPLLKTIKKITK